MRSLLRSALLLGLLALLGLGTAETADTHAPEITAQGFDITEVQQGPLGDFGRIRVRFEVPDRIEDLYIKERSYDVDLAKTPETAHFPLFGLDRQVRQLTDVTLNFQNYINEKLDAEGEYVFELRVTDRSGRSASAKLRVRVVAQPQVKQEPGNAAVETAPFRFTRIGASAVSGADEFGITWKTIESTRVIIELTKQKTNAERLVVLKPSDYDEVRSKKQLAHKTRGGDTPTLRLATANNKAAGSVFAVVNRQVPYLLKVTSSSTSLSEVGTTVTLIGEYKY
jgi:hypothetical protein